LSEATLVARAKRRTRHKDGSSGYKTKRGKVSKRAHRIIGQAAILKDTGRLFRSLAYKARPEGVAVGSNMVQAGLMQFGGKAGRGKKVEIPARPFMGISTDDTADIKDVLEDFVKERVEK